MGASEGRRRHDILLYMAWNDNKFVIIFLHFNYHPFEQLISLKCGSGAIYAAPAETNGDRGGE